MQKYDKLVYNKRSLRNTIIKSVPIYDIPASKDKRRTCKNIEFIELTYFDRDLVVCTKRFKYKEMRTAIQNARSQEDRFKVISNYIGELKEFTHIMYKARCELESALIKSYKGATDKDTSHTRAFIKDEFSKAHLKPVYYYTDLIHGINYGKEAEYNTVSQRVFARLKVGDSLPEKADYLCEVSKDYKSFVFGVEGCSVDENINIISSKEGTFDYIYVWIFLPADSYNVDFVKEHKATFDQMVLEKLYSTKEFIKFNVPVNFLRIERITLRRNNLEYVVGLKMNEIE